MCDTAMHHEALRKKRLLERKAMALQKMAEQQGGDVSCMPTGGYMETEHGAGLHAMHAEQSRLTKFRVNDDGFENRYRARADLNPHVDRMYAIVYPGGDNSDYTADAERNERRQNRAESAYDARVRFVPGHMRDQVYSTIHPGEDRSAYYNYGQPQATMAATYGIAYQHQQYDHSRNGPQRPNTWNDVERQLKHEAKVLRDHNLYMGHTSAFKDLYNRDMLDPRK